MIYTETMRKMKYSKRTWCFILLTLIYVVGLSGCITQPQPSMPLGEGEVTLSLSSMLKGTISNATGTGDDQVTRLLIIFMPRTTAAVTIVDVNTSTADVQTDASDPSKTYITIGTEGKPVGTTDNYEIKLPQAGQYDIIFIANPTTEIASDVYSKPFKGMMLDLLEKGYTYEASNAAASAHIRAMSMVYRDQTIGQGTYEAPFEWKAPVPTTQPKLAPVSNYPESEIQGGDRVGLVRTMAKMKLTVKNLSNDCLKAYQPTNIKVTLHNVPKTFSLIETPWDSSATVHSEIVLYNKPWDGTTEVKVTDSYFPEKVFAPGSDADWENNQATGGTIYFKVEVTRRDKNTNTYDLVTYQLPLVSSTNAQQEKLDNRTLRFLDLITERDAVFSVYRNRYYQYTMSMPWDIGPQAVTIKFKSTPVEEITYDVPVFE